MTKEHTLCYETDICIFGSLDQIWVYIYISFSTLENLEQQLRMQLDASVGRISKGIRRLLLSCPLLMHWEIGKALCFRMSFSRLWLTDHVITRPQLPFALSYKPSIVNSPIKQWAVCGHIIAIFHPGLARTLMQLGLGGLCSKWPYLLSIDQPGCIQGVISANQIEEKKMSCNPKSYLAIKTW